MLKYLLLAVLSATFVLSSAAVYDLQSNIVVPQNVNEAGLVVIGGKFKKPYTTDHVKLSIKYKNTQGEWVTGWCKTLYSYNQYNENLKAAFELPPSDVNPYKLKIELSSDADTINFGSITWQKTVSHYKSGQYTPEECDLDENEYTILLTPRKDGTLILDSDGKVKGVKDRVTSAHSWNKLFYILMDNKQDDVVFTLKNPGTLVTDSSGAKSVKMINEGAKTDVLGATPELIYNVSRSHPIPYLYSYSDPVYMFAGKFSINGFFIKFSQWPGEVNGPGYHSFTNPNSLKSRYFNLYNSIHDKLWDFMSDQQPIVIVSSMKIGLRIYKRCGTYFNVTAHSNYGGPYFGYTDSRGVRRGPGSEDFIVSNTSEMTLYGMCALRNNFGDKKPGNIYDTVRTMPDLEKEIFKFIKYTRIFGDSPAYDDVSECAERCFAIKTGATPA